MKLLFSSSHRGLVDVMGKRLAEAGFSCEIRYRVVPGDLHSDYKELWVQMDNNIQWACSLLSLHCAVGRN